MDAFALAHRTGDEDGRREIYAAILAFNRKWPEIAITPKTIRRSLLQRAKYSERTEHGIAINQRIGGRIREMVGAEEMR